MSGFLWVALGGALGSVARHAVNLWSAARFGAGFPWGTFTVNVAGSFVMGVLITLLARKWPEATDARLFLATGILGGFTTFSAFSMDTVNLVSRGVAASAGAYVLGSVVFSLAAAFAGVFLVRAVLS